MVRLAHVGPSLDAADDEAVPDTLIRAKVARQEVVSPSSDRRARCRIPVEIDVMVHSADALFQASSADVSPGGMFVVTFRELPPGTHVVLDFRLPSGAALELEGIVCWRRGRPDGGPAGVGVAFCAVPEEAAEALAAYCSVREALYLDFAC